MSVYVWEGNEKHHRSTPHHTSWPSPPTASILYYLAPRCFVVAVTGALVPTYVNIEMCTCMCIRASRYGEGNLKRNCSPMSSKYGVNKMSVEQSITCLRPLSYEWTRHVWEIRSQRWNPNRTSQNKKREEEK